GRRREQPIPGQGAKRDCKSAWGAGALCAAGARLEVEAGKRSLSSASTGVDSERRREKSGFRHRPAKISVGAALRQQEPAELFGSDLCLAGLSILRQAAVVLKQAAKRQTSKSQALKRAWDFFWACRRAPLGSSGKN